MGAFIIDQGVMTLVTIAIIALCVAIALHVLYSVIWRAVRRGLREFHAPTRGAAPTSRRPLRSHARDTEIEVPNYLPSDWT